VIIVSFSNLEPKKSSMAMDIEAIDQQTNKSITITNIEGGETKTGVIDTGKQTLDAGTVKFKLTWTDGHSGTDTRSAKYKAQTKCESPSSTPNPTAKPSATPTPTLPVPTGIPEPTITSCPTLEPVPSVRIECPNCVE
jgi:hypothetical protein